MNDLQTIPDLVKRFFKFTIFYISTVLFIIAANRMTEHVEGGPSGRVIGLPLPWRFVGGPSLQPAAGRPAVKEGRLA